MAILLVRISVGLISIVAILCVKAVGMNAHELITGLLGQSRKTATEWACGPSAEAQGPLTLCLKV